MRASLLIFFLFSLSAFGAVEIKSQLADKAQATDPDHYICLGEGWRETNIYVHRQITDLKKVYPDLFVDLSEEQVNCFAPSEVSFSAQRPLDDILNHIEAGSEDSFYVKVQEDGSIIPSKAASSTEHLVGDLGLRNEGASLGRKILRAESVVGGIEVIKIGALIAAPRTITQWEEGWNKHIGQNIKRAWNTKPVFDKDGWAMNYVGHPYGGSIYYNALRSQGASRLQSFIFAAIHSTIWEYSLEAIAEKPSIQDLVVTPVIGSIMGELSHMATGRMARNGFNFGEKVLVTVINPTFVINNGFKLRR